MGALVLAMWLAGCGDTSRPGSAGAGNEPAGSGSGGTGGGSAAAATGAVVSVGQGDTGTEGQCQREVTLEGVTLSAPEPFDLVIVADHSASLAWSRDELAAGLTELLTQVKGASLRVVLLTPTQYGADSAAARMPVTNTALVAWQDAETGQAYSPAVTSFQQTCTDPEGTPIDCPDPEGMLPYLATGSWTFRPAEPIAVIRPEMTDAEFEAQQQAVTDAILNLGGTGSPDEQPLCTLARYVTQPASALPQHAVFLLISDEDDVSLPSECLSGYQAGLSVNLQEVLSEACSSDCDTYRYTATGTIYGDAREASCAGFTDTGEMIEGTERAFVSFDPVPSCDDVVERPCTEAERAAVFCESGLSVVQCEHTCVRYDDVICAVQVADPDVDACTESFTFDGSTYAELADYCEERGITGFNDCSGQGYYVEHIPSASGNYTPIPLVDGTGTSDLGDYFLTQAASAFASGKFLLEGIVFEPTSSCQLGSGQSYATNLIEVIGDPARVFPLCESYAPALDVVAEFAQSLLQTDYTLELEDDERVNAVVVIAQDGSERSLEPSDYTVDESTGQLAIDESALRGTDASLRVELTSECRPPPQ